ncbi:MAG: polysaccharide biosynthesis tyrosine autokinase, partial [Anaerolineales bacterium]|nr:polysaccharide biosynthesis tyrosine autokinase [Anaerolineales bacterium]
NKPLIGEFPYDDAFRRLRINLVKMTDKVEMKILMLTSSQPDEGKSTISTNLAISLAETGRRVLLVDADLHRPSLHELFELPNAIGLSNIAKGTLPPTMAIQESEYPGLEILTTGPVDSDPSLLLEEADILPILNKLKPDYDFILLNTPAYLGVADAALLTSGTDGVLLIAKKGFVCEPALRSTCQQLMGSDSRILGLIINNDSPPLSKDYYRYYSKKQPSPYEPSLQEKDEASSEAVPSLASKTQLHNPPAERRNFSTLVKGYSLKRAFKRTQVSNEEKSYQKKPLKQPPRIVILMGNSPNNGDSRIPFHAKLLSEAGYAVRIISPYQSDLSQIQSNHGISFQRYVSPAGNRFFWNLILAPVFSSFVLLWVWMRHGLDVLYVINPPDTLVFAGLLPKLFGKTMLLDIREPLPELFATEYHRSGGMRYKSTGWLERLAIRFVHHVTVPNDTCRQLLVNRVGTPMEKVSVISHAPDLDQMKPTEPDTNLRSRAETILAFQSDGSNRDGADLLLNALYYLKNSYSYHDWFCIFLGARDKNGHLAALAEDLEIEDHLW